MKCKVIRFALGKPAQPAIEVELKKTEHLHTYNEVLTAACVQYDERTTQLMFAHAGNTFFSGNTSPDSYVRDGETVGVFDLALFTPAPTGKSKANTS